MENSQQFPNISKTDYNSFPTTKNIFSQIGVLPILFGVSIITVVAGTGGYIFGTQKNQLSTQSSFQQPSPTPLTAPSVSASPASTEELIFAYNHQTKKAETQAYKTDRSHKLFSEEEVQEIRANIAQPYFDYHDEVGSEAIVIIISKPSLSFKAIYNNGGQEWSAHTTEYKGKLYWAPGCMGPCEFSDAFKMDHPKTVALSECLSSYPPDPNTCIEAFFQ